jgi:TRAP-type transport system small permease protein
MDVFFLKQYRWEGKNVVNFVVKTKNILDKAILSFTTVLFIVMVLLVFAQVIFRYVFHNSLSWSEEISRYLLVWIIFLSTGYVLGKKAHIYLDVIFLRFPRKVRNVLHKVSALLMMFYAFIVAYYGFELMLIGGRQKSPAVEIPMNLVYIALPLGGLLMMAYCFFAFFDEEGENS